MKKRFNITGVCIPRLHYMMDNRAKLDAVMEMVELGDYFTINRPRQYGKTTTLHLLQERLEATKDYICLKLSFEDVDEKWQQSDELFAQMFAIRLGKELSNTHALLKVVWDDLVPTVTDSNTLSEAISHMAHKAEKEIVLLIDEVDASSNYVAFLKFLSMLRNKYLERYRPGNETFHSLVLAGVHDIKALKFKLRNPNEVQFNSPWNIAADFKVPMYFNPKEIATMLVEYSHTKGVEMEIPVMADKLYYYTSGYPFLVSKLCKTIAEDILPNKDDKIWTLQDIENSVLLLLKENNTNFDSLIKNLENNSELYDLVYRVLIESEVIPFNPDEPVTNLGRLYGIFKDNGQLKIHNRIYEQRLYNYMTVKTMIALKSQYNYSSHFTLEHNALEFV